MVEVFKSGFLADFIFKLMHRAGGLDRLDATTGSANEKVAMAVWQKQGEISGPLVEAKAADQAVLIETLEQTEDGRFIALINQPCRARQLGKCHRPRTFQQGGDEFFKGLGAAQACTAAALDGITD